ncbi:MAG: hypothetical protein IPN87_10750 [Saprospiraceae bacterium]|nr:hypothetical protein [Candidatus Brachybacter algidus]
MSKIPFSMGAPDNGSFLKLGLLMALKLVIPATNQPEASSLQMELAELKVCRQTSLLNLIWQLPFQLFQSKMAIQDSSMMP